MSFTISMANMVAAPQAIDPVFLDSRVVKGSPLDVPLGCRLIAKVEIENPVGSFKGRGTELFAATALAPGDSLVCASAGNFGQGLARAAIRRSHACTVFAAENAPAMKLSLAAGRAISTADVNTIADGIAVRVPIPGIIPLLSKCCDDVVAVTEADIVQAMQLVYRRIGMLLEPAGATGIAAILADPQRFRGRRVATLFSGGNLSNDMRSQLTSLPT